MTRPLAPWLARAGASNRWSLVLWVALAGCTGAIGDAPAPGAGGRPGAGPAGAGGATGAIGAVPLRRLTNAEYDATVRDLLGDSTHPASRFPPDVNPRGFSNDVAMQLVSPSLAEMYASAARDLAGAAVTDLGALLGCDPAAEGELACVQAFVARFGSRAYRRPLADAEVTRLVALFSSVRAGATLSHALEVLLGAMLSSPHFLYRVELGDTRATATADTIPLTQYEIASRLSYLLWGTMPDDELFAAAAEGRLASPDEIGERARAMLESPRAREITWRFVGEWVGVGRIGSVTKSAEVFPEFDDAMRDAMAADARAFVDYVLWETDGSLETLLGAPVGFVDERNASIYGVAAPGGGLGRVDLDPARRAGILTHPALLAVYANPLQTDPVRRGKLVRERLLCQNLPPPPPDIMPIEPEPSTGATTRERYEQHASDPACASCHALMDPIGFGFEHYDPIGRWRDSDGGVPVDARGEILESPTLGGAFDGVPELARRLAASPEVADCATRQWFRFAVARRETEADGDTLRSMRDAFDASGHDLRELMLAIVRTRAFLSKPIVR